jgi:hypothetical protein
MFPKDSPYMDSPITWVRDRLGEFMWSKQRSISRAVNRERYVAVPSCHDSGKSYTASRLCCWWIDAHPPGQAFVVTTAPTAHQVDAILWREIGRAHRKGGLVGRVTLDAKWRLGPAYGDELVAYGRKPADYDPEAFQGIHQLYVLVVIDEANGVPKILYDAVDTLVTNRNARMLAIGNPDSPTSHFAQICRRGSGWKVIHIDGLKTPNFTNEKVPAELHDLLLSKEWVEERRLRWGEGSPLWQSKVRGQFPSMGEDCLIQPEWWDKAVERSLSPEGHSGQFGVDIARFGEDRTMCYRYRAGHLRRAWSMHHADTMETANRVAVDLVRHRGLVPAVVDETGVGAGVVDRLREMGHSVIGFTSARSAGNTLYANLRSEAYWHFRELFEFGQIDVDPNDDELMSQLTSMKWRVNRRGQIEVESKEDYMKRLRTHSPDAGDGAMMAAWTGLELDTSVLDHAADEPAIMHDLLEAVW